MDRLSREPAPRPAPQPEAADAADAEAAEIAKVAESPLSFPVEAPRPTAFEPGAGAPAEAAPVAGSPLSPREAARPPADPLAFPAEAAPVAGSPFSSAEGARPLGDPLAFPAEAAPPAGSPLSPVEAARPPADPLAFPAAATPLTAPPHVPAGPSAGPTGSEPGAAGPGDPLAFPAAATPLTAPPLFPAETTAGTTAASLSSAPLPFPVAELPGISAPPPAPEAAPQPAPTHIPPSPLFRFGPPLLAAIAALLAIGGCFLPLFQLVQELDFRQGFLDARMTITQTAWGNTIQVTGQQPTDRPALPVGIPVVVAIGLLAVAAFAAFSRPDRGLSRWLLSAGAVFAAGVVTTIGMGRFELAALAGDEVGLEVGTGPGMWLLAAATVLAAGAAVVAYLPYRAPGWADPAVAYADTPTPPSGVAITVLPPDEPGDPGDPRLR